MRSCLFVILAAGQGTRMKSDLPKILHQVAGLPMVGHVVKTAQCFESSARAVVIGPDADTVRSEILTLEPDAFICEQRERLGTAHAVLAARAAIEKGYDDVVVLYGDTPLVTAETLRDVRQTLAEGAAVAVLGFQTDDPTGYGRLLVEEGKLLAIREEKECTSAEKRVTFCNSGIMGFSGQSMLSLLDQIDNTNTKGEYYLTDAVEVANAEGLNVVALEGDEDDILGVNNRLELSQAEAIFQRRRREEMMLAGVTMQAPESVIFAHDTIVGPDTIIEPHVVFANGVTVAAGATIRAFSHLEGAQVATGAIVGPYARLRPGANLEEGAKVGNFCEVKKADIRQGAKVNHLTYIGDAEIGAAANIGAGTITCNYDGFNKHKTTIGANAFIGSNTSLVAPVRIDDGGYVGSGSVVTQDVAADALAIARARQVNKEGLAKRLRDKLAAEKARKKAKN